jgi:DNA-binding protein YbaB
LKVENKKKRRDRIHERCLKLEELGFRVNHEDSSICINHENYFQFDCEEIEVDFSATDENKFIQKAVLEAYKFGIEKGEKNIKQAMKNILDL